MERITEKQLEAVVTRINKMTRSPETPYTLTGDRNVANIGNYHLESAFGKHKLVRMVDSGGCTTDVLQAGFMPKRELYYMLCAFISGIETANTQ